MQLSSRGIALATAALHVAAVNRAARAQNNTPTQPERDRGEAKAAVDNRGKPAVG